MLGVMVPIIMYTTEQQPHQITISQMQSICIGDGLVMASSKHLRATTAPPIIIGLYKPLICIKIPQGHNSKLLMKIDSI